MDRLTARDVAEARRSPAFHDAGLCIGGPRDGEQVAVSGPNRTEFTVPTTESLPVAASVGASIEVQNHLYRRELLSEESSVYAVWVHQSIKPGGIMAALIEGYARRQSSSKE